MLNRIKFLAALLAVTTGVAPVYSAGFFGKHLREEVQSITSAAGTTTLTVTSNPHIVVTGSTTQTIRLPDATTLANGLTYSVANQSTGTVTIQYAGASTLYTLGAGASVKLRLMSGATSDGSWGAYSANKAPTSVTDNAVVRFDGTTGTVTQNSVVTISDGGGITLPEVAEPSTPASNNKVFYIDSADGATKVKDDAGVVVNLEDGSGTTAVNELSGLLNNYSLTATVGSSELTISLKDSAGSNPSSGSPVSILFQNITQTSGAPVVRTVTSALSVTVDSGATLGHLSGIEDYIYVYAIDNAGTVELAVSSSLKDDGYRRSTGTAVVSLSSGADSHDLIYAENTRTSISIRLIGRLTSTQTTAGTWAANMTEVSPFPFRTKEKSWGVVATIASGTDILLDDSSSGAWSQIEATGLTLTAASGSDQVFIACANGTSPTGTTCTAANEAIGIGIYLPRNGWYMSCVSYLPYNTDTGSNGEDVGLEFRQTRTVWADTNEIESGSSTMYMHRQGVDAMNNSDQQTNCWSFNWTGASSGSPIALRLQQWGFDSGGNGALITATDSGNPTIQWTVFPMGH